MPVVPIIFGPSQETGLAALAGGSPVAHNVVMDGKGAVTRRPGLAAHCSLTAGTEVVGLHARGDALFAVQVETRYHEIFVVKGALGAAASRKLSGISSELNGVERPVWADTEALVVLVNGKDAQKIDVRLPDNPVSSRLAVPDEAPPRATHIIANSSRLLVNSVGDYSTRCYYSDVALGTLSTTGHETWVTGTSGSFTAEARPDSVVALGENTNEVFLWGAETVQVFQPDPSYVYSPAITAEHGCLAPYSVARVDQSFAWLDHRRRFVLGNGRELEVISGPIQSELDVIDSPETAYGYRVQVGGKDLLLWKFGEDGRTFAFQRGVGWGQWSGWDATYNRLKNFAGNAHAFSVEQGRDFLGTDDGRIGYLSEQASDDLGDPVRAYVLTGFQNQGTSARKRCKCVRLTLRRGSSGEAYASRVGSLSWRDDEGAWSPPLTVDLGDYGEREVVLRFDSLGVYRTRQWRFEFGGVAPLVLAAAEEEFEVL